MKQQFTVFFDKVVLRANLCGTWGAAARDAARGLRFREHRMQKSAAACSLRWGEPPSVYDSCAAFVAEGAARERPGLQPRDRFQERRHNKSTECKKKRRKKFKICEKKNDIQVITWQNELLG